jgi:hypothetical protein
MSVGSSQEVCLLHLVREVSAGDSDGSHQADDGLSCEWY